MLSRTATSAKRALLLAGCLLLAACESRSPVAAPSIVFDKVPRGDVGGPDTRTIGGRAISANRVSKSSYMPEAKDSGGSSRSPTALFTAIQGDSRWKNQTHLGSQYAALLVNQGYRPARPPKTLPSPGGTVIASAVVTGEGPLPAEIPLKTVNFSGYDWTVRRAASYRGGSHNSFGAENAWTDKNGALHLRVTRRDPDWICAEVEADP